MSWQLSQQQASHQPSLTYSMAALHSSQQTGIQSTGLEAAAAQMTYIASSLTKVLASLIMSLLMMSIFAARSLIEVHVYCVSKRSSFWFSL